jgi:hypothetical protein
MAGRGLLRLTGSVARRSKLIDARDQISALETELLHQHELLSSERAAHLHTGKIMVERGDLLLLLDGKLERYRRAGFWLMLVWAFGLVERP